MLCCASRKDPHFLALAEADFGSISASRFFLQRKSAFPFRCFGMGQERELQMQRLLELFDAHLGARLLQMLVMLLDIMSLQVAEGDLGILAGSLGAHPKAKDT